MVIYLIFTSHFFFTFHAPNNEILFRRESVYLRKKKNENDLSLSKPEIVLHYNTFLHREIFKKSRYVINYLL